MFTEVDAIEAEVNLSNEECRALFERRMQLFCRIRVCREENEKVGLESTISDNWTAGQRQIFLRDWLHDHSITEGALQTGRGEKRSHGKMMKTKHHTRSKTLKKGTLRSSERDKLDAPTKQHFG